MGAESCAGQRSVQRTSSWVRGGAFTTSALISAGMFAMFLFLAYYLQLDLG